MTLSQVHPLSDMSLALDRKPRVLPAPNSLISSSSSSAIDRVSAENLSGGDSDVSLSDTESPASSIRSSSDTYVNDFGGQVVLDRDWPADRVSRVDAYRVYDSTDDEMDATRRQALAYLDSSDIGVYDDWAEVADDQLSLEDLQNEADVVANAIEAVSMNGAPLVNSELTSIDSLDDVLVENIPIVQMPDETNKTPAKQARTRKAHKRVETLQDDDFPDMEMPWNGHQSSHAPTHQHIESPPLLTIPPLPKPKKGKRRHRRIETLQDLDPLELEEMKQIGRGHRRIEILPDGDTFGMSAASPPPLKRIETLDDQFDLSTPPPFPPSPTADLNDVESPQDEDLDMTTVSSATNDGETPNGEAASLDRRRTSETTNEADKTLQQRKQQLPAESPPNGIARCPKLSQLSKRLAEVTRGLSDVQMGTAGRAASAETCLGKMNTASTRAEICSLRITLDHLAKLTLERAFATSDETERHRHVK